MAPTGSWNQLLSSEAHFFSAPQKVWGHRLFGRELPGSHVDRTPGLRGDPAHSHNRGSFSLRPPGSHKQLLPLHFFSSVWKVWALGALWSLTSSWSRWNMELVQEAWMRGDCSCFRGPRRSGWLFRCRQASDIPTSFHSGSPSGQGFGLSQAGRPFSGGLKNTTWRGCWHCQDGAERKRSGRQALPRLVGAASVPGPFHPTAAIRRTERPLARSPGAGLPAEESTRFPQFLAPRKTWAPPRKGRPLASPAPDGNG